MPLPINATPVPAWITHYGQTTDLDALLIAVYGQLVTAGEEPFIPDHSDRAVSLLIEQFRKPYRVYEY